VGSAADRATVGIRSLIASHEYRAGDKLPPERELALRLGLSRPALREGIRRLRSGGLLEARRGSGTYIAEIDLAGIYEIRIRLEPLAADRAAQRRNSAELAAMRTAIETMRERFAQRDVYILADRDFHRTLACASRNQVLEHTLDTLDELVDVSRSVLLADDKHLARGLVDVQRIYTAIEREHPRRAANAMEHHIMVVRDAYLKSLSRRDSALGKRDRQNFGQP
jgi:GntR family transcriptional regulator, transcriptional repressor for pyruvate dehydrogenase complex